MLMPFFQTNGEMLTMTNIKDLRKEMERNNRIINLCLGIPITYEGNVKLTEELKKDYTGTLGEVLKEALENAKGK